MNLFIKIKNLLKGFFLNLVFAVSDNEQIIIFWRNFQKTIYIYLNLRLPQDQEILNDWKEYLNLVKLKDLRIKIYLNRIVNSQECKYGDT